MQVGAQFDRREVVFAGPFKGYGQILIIQHGDAYRPHFLLECDGSTPPWVSGIAGEPIGIMGTQEDGARLYVEVRRKVNQ